MDFSFSDEQELLRSTARELLTIEYPIERVARLADGDGFDRAGWKLVADAGWTAISVPEDERGAGLGFVEEMIVAEELGRALFPGPFLASIVMALPLLRGGGASELARQVGSGERIATVAWLGTERPGDPSVDALSWDGERLEGTRVLVPDLAVADTVVVIGLTGGDLALWTLDPDGSGATIREMPTVDRTRRLGELVLDMAPACLLARGDHATELVDALRDRALAALAAEAVGVASRALELAVAHANERRQFGRAIGSFQGVSHELARAYMDVELSRSLTYWAAWAVAAGEPAAPAAAAAAKARSTETAVLTCERGIQALGGVGFTWEHPMHRFYKRALAIAAMLGTSDELWSRTADRVLGPAPTVTLGSPT
jgi:alkylation response protein AidB-like acyl-CoA dehydrogenase